MACNQYSVGVSLSTDAFRTDIVSAGYFHERFTTLVEPSHNVVKLLLFSWLARRLRLIVSYGDICYVTFYGKFQSTSEVHRQSRQCRYRRLKVRTISFTIHGGPVANRFFYFCCLSKFWSVRHLTWVWRSKVWSVRRLQCFTCRSSWCVRVKTKWPIKQYLSVYNLSREFSDFVTWIFIYGFERRLSVFKTVDLTYIDLTILTMKF